jgi:hypothetical protein
MKSRHMILLLCAIGIGLVAVTSAKTGLIEFCSTTNDLTDLPDTETTPGADPASLRSAEASQITIESKTSPDYNDLTFGLTPVLTTETQTPMDIVHHSH